MYYRKKWHSKTMERYKKSILMAEFKHHTITDDNYNVEKVKDATRDKYNIINNNRSSTDRLSMSISMSNNDNPFTLKSKKRRTTESIVSYVSGFAKTSSHFVIGEMLFEIYDVFTDIAYLIELYNNDNIIAFCIFLTSICITLILNGILLILFFKNSFQNWKFRKWFWEYNGIIISLLCFSLLTDACIVVSLFTSQIFGHLVFYSPLDLKDIKQMKISAFLSVFAEHLPQLSVVCYILFFQSSTTTIGIASFIVSGIDLFVTIFKMIVWFFVVKNIE